MADAPNSVMPKQGRRRCALCPSTLRSPAATDLQIMRGRRLAAGAADCGSGQFMSARWAVGLAGGHPCLLNEVGDCSTSPERERANRWTTQRRGSACHGYDRCHEAACVDCLRCHRANSYDGREARRKLFPSGIQMTQSTLLPAKMQRQKPCKARLALPFWQLCSAYRSSCRRRYRLRIKHSLSVCIRWFSITHTPSAAATRRMKAAYSFFDNTRATAHGHSGSNCEA